MALEPALFDFCPWDFYIPSKYRRHQPMITSEFPYVKIPHPSAIIQDLKTNKLGKDGFQAQMSVKHFEPNEVTVRTVGNDIIVEGKHDDREDDHGTVSRHFIRTYTLPKHCDPRDIVSNLSSDGILTVEVPPKKDETKKECIVEIQHTGAPAPLPALTPLLRSNEPPHDVCKVA